MDIATFFPYFLEGVASPERQTAHYFQLVIGFHASGWFFETFLRLVKVDRSVELSFEPSGRQHRRKVKMMSIKTKSTTEDLSTRRGTTTPSPVSVPGYSSSSSTTMRKTS
ncbi:MAG: hypothetical protein HOV94_07525 [Saccharothrix sp.]|nr:hypothetical protein [Saccharothrix sp.]